MIKKSDKERAKESCLLLACQALHGGQLHHVLAAERLLTGTSLSLYRKEQMAKRHSVTLGIS